MKTEELFVESRVISTPAHGDPRQYAATAICRPDLLGLTIRRQEEQLIRMMRDDGTLFGAAIGPMQTRTRPWDPLRAAP